MSVSLRSRARGRRFAALAVGAAVAFGGACAPPTGSGTTSPVVVYNSNPSPLPGNVASIGYEATSTSEFGDHVTLQGAPRNLQSATVTMSAWGLQSSWPGVGDATGFDHPLTLTLYNVGPNDGNGKPTVGSAIASRTQLFHIPWRPEADPTCPSPTAWKDDNGDCFNGKAFQVTFNLASLGITSPNSIIWTVSYNTSHHGPAPLGVGGPYDSLNVGTSPDGATVGTDVDEDAAFVDSTWSGFYCDGGAGGTGTLRYDGSPGCWVGYTPAISIVALP